MRFAYSSGQRPLAGYTIKRGIGRGGFGEVYFAISDGGKEVAIKLLRDNHEVELRGVALCLNLKHPNLVALYDQRKDQDGNHWVVMEYVAGEALSTIIGRHPNGLHPDLACEWFLGMARALTYLHENGIVHRDIKPGNIFIENGVVKVGDYGLSKSISSSQAQTQSVGSVHYMAPEIASGNYSKAIDIYAAGVVLYQLLTGQVPFDGQTTHEVLMKHLTSSPDLSRVPAEFMPILARALDKNPAHRFGSMMEFVRCIEGVLKAEKKPELTSPLQVAPGLVLPPSLRPERLERPVSPPINVPWREQIRELCLSLVMSVVVAGLVVPVWAGLFRAGSMTKMLPVFFETVLCCWAILIPAKIWNQKPGDSWLRRMIMLGMGVFVGAAALWLDGWSPADAALEQATSSFTALIPATILTEASYFSVYGLGFFALRWWRMTERQRPARFSFGPVFAAAFWAFILFSVIQPRPWHAVPVLILTALIVQVVSPWREPPARPARRMRLRHVEA